MLSTFHSNVFYMYMQYGATPLWLATANGHMQCVQLLVRANADISKQKEV